MKDTVFYLGLGALLTHELDAVANHEWRVFPGLRALSDDTGMWVFVAAHVPLFAIVIAWIASARPERRLRSRMAVAAFLVVHGLLHAFNTHHESYEFSSLLSSILIFGGAALGAAYLIVEDREARSRLG